VANADRARVDRIVADRHVSVDEIKAHPENFGLNSRDILRYDQAGKAQDGLSKLAEKTKAPTMLLIYKPEAFDGQGRAAIVIGDPDRATNVAVVVPGTSHSLAEGWLGDAKDPANVYLEMERLGDRNAVYAWMGYDAPDSLTDPRVATTALAREGGRQLASDVNGLRSTAMVSQHYTVIGHSYGSTTVADAAVMGMKTNDVVLVGSPGTDLARSAADFHLASGGHVFVGATSTDPVTHIGALTSTTPWGPGALGADPAVDGFGSTRFHAEVTAITDNANAHSHYFDTGSDALRSMGLIASGNGDALQSNELTAAHRDGLHVPGGLLQPKDLAEVLAGQYAEGTLPQSLLEDLANGNPTRIGRIGGAVGVLVEDIYDDPEFGR